MVVLLYKTTEFREIEDRDWDLGEISRVDESRPGECEFLFLPDYDSVGVGSS